MHNVSNEMTPLDLRYLVISNFGTPHKIIIEHHYTYRLRLNNDNELDFI